MSIKKKSMLQLLQAEKKLYSLLDQGNAMTSPCVVLQYRRVCGLRKNQNQKLLHRGSDH